MQESFKVVNWNQKKGLIYLIQNFSSSYDRKDIADAFCNWQNVDWIALSFVKRQEIYKTYKN
jgi:pyruvate kinase